MCGVCLKIHLLKMILDSFFNFIFLVIAQLINKRVKNFKINKICQDLIIKSKNHYV